MTFEESVEWLYATQKFGIKLGLENTRRLLSALGDPQTGLRVIHVAGTNGKGSVCAMAESILRHAEYRTGLFTSPHLVDFCERIRVGGVNVPTDFVARELTRIREISATWEHCPTFLKLSLPSRSCFFPGKNVMSLF
ncbi:MAG: bifunctional folylpolyglutamate synthase/dihydrofolate synthase, partial [Chthoniobacterales bacterium]